MRILIIGAGRMGMRHVVGACRSKSATQVTVLDVREEALTSGQDNIREREPERSGIVQFQLVSEYEQNPGPNDVAIIASTANDRLGVIELALSSNCKHLLLEKPLAQSTDEVNELIEYLNEKPVSVAVNLNMRLYKSYQQLKTDLSELPQMQGKVLFGLNMGSIGIGANGIHYLDLILFLSEADRAEVVAGEIDSEVIPSGRGPEFGDYGGWCVVKLFKEGQQVGRATVTLSATSTAFGGWDIIGTHGRIRVNEIEGLRQDQLRKPDSDLPVYRYAADYLPISSQPFEIPYLEDLAAKWIDAVAKGEQILPGLPQAALSHQLMFDWLAYSKADTSNIT